jgi:hypothetical protein
VRTLSIEDSLILTQAERSMEFWRRNLNDVAARYRDEASIHQRLSIAGNRMRQTEGCIKRLRERHEPKDFQPIL